MSDQTTLTFNITQPAPTGSVDLRHGDCLTVLRDLPDNSIDSVITDPPYGLSNTKPAQVADVLAAWVTGDTEAVPAKKGGFMGKDWDSFVPPPAVWAECLRVLKPGGHMAVFAGARTQDLMGLSIRLAGFEIRDTLGWIYGSGFPKSQNIGKAIDKRGGVPHIAVEVGAAIRDARIARGLSKSWCDKHFCGGSTNWTWFEGRPSGIRPPTDEDFQRIVNEWPELAPYAEKVAEVDREVVGKNKWTNSANHFVPGEDHTERVHTDITAPASDAAKQWDGWGTALKPAIEPIILARKPLDGTVAANVLAHGVGGLNIDASRVSSVDSLVRPEISRDDNAVFGKGLGAGSQVEPAGRFPANVLLDEHAAAEMDRQSGWQKDGVTVNRNLDPEASTNEIFGRRKNGERPPIQTYGGEGGASRFFPVFKYQAKAPKKERPVIERPPMLQLRDDLTPEQVDHVRARLQEVGLEIE